MKTSSFLCGVGAGMIAGVTIGAITIMKRNTMRTGVGRAMQQAGATMDSALYGLWHAVR